MFGFAFHPIDNYTNFLLSVQGVSQLPERWSIGVLDFWINGVMQSSITPILH
jgi:hypothetical protein